MRIKTKYPNIYYDDVRKKYEYRKMINGALLLGRADTPEEALKYLIEDKSRNSVSIKGRKKKNNELPCLNIICKSYLKDRKSELKSTTHYRLSQILNIYVINKFRDVPVDKLIEKDFKNWYKFLSNYEINTRSKNKYLNILRSIFKYINNIYGYNCLYINRLHNFKDYTIKEPTNDFKVITIDDFKKIYENVSDYDKLLLLTLYLFGLRSGELLGLTKKSFLFENNTLCIYQAVSWKTRKKGYALITPKTSTSNRNYPLPESYKELILKHIEANKIKEDGFIFFSPRNKKDPLSTTSLQRKLEYWSSIVNYHLYPHLFRHSSISELYSENVPLDVISNLVGHSSTKITELVYLHQTEEKKVAITDLMEKLIKEK